MSKVMLWTVMACFMFSSISCVMIVKEEERGPYDPGCISSDPVIAEIDAVADLSFDSHRHDAYKRIAEREGLSEPAQVHLVNQALKHLSFENMKESVLLALIENDSFTCEAQRAILSQLKKLNFENTKQSILSAIDQHNPCAD